MDSRSILFEEAEKFLKDQQKDLTGAVYEWNEDLAVEFSQIPIETLIRDSYFLGMGDKVYDGVLEDILDLYEERKKRQINLVLFLEGIGSGKTVKASIIEWLLWYEITMYQPSPQEYFDLAPRSVIALINMNRCITGDSLIISNQGIKRIDSFFNLDHKEKTSVKTNSLILSSRNGKQRVSELYFNGVSKVKKIILRNGLEISGTLNHPILCGKQYVQLKDLEIGDSVTCQYNQQMFGNNSLIDKELAYVLGVLIGDGQLGHERGYIKWCSDKKESQHSERCKTIINEHFCNGYDMVSRQDYDDRNVYIYSVQHSARKEFRILLNKIGMNTEGELKRVPNCILEAPKEIQISFLQGLFDTEGCALKLRPRVSLTSTSKRLLQEVQIMLLNLGIISNLKKKKRKKGNNKAWSIYIYGLQARNFYEKVGFWLKRKQETLKASLIERDFHNFNDWIDIDLWNEEIVDIEFSEKELTYDFSMENEPNFIAMGIVNHNTEKQAKKVTFSEVWNRFQTQFNKDYFPTDPQVRSEIRIQRNNTVIFPGTSSALSALGYNLYGGVIDEAAFLEVVDDSTKTFDGKLDAAEEMYHAIMNRMTSRFLRRGELPGMLCMISSPNFPDDFMHRQIELAMKMAQEAKEKDIPDMSGIFWRRRPTWEAKGKKFFPENDFFYIDTENAEIINDPKVIMFLDNVNPDKFPLEMEMENLFEVARYIKEN